MQIKIEIDADKVLKAMLRAPDDFTQEVRVEMKKQMTLVQRIAKQVHRFVARRGGAGLEGSIKTEVSASGFFGRVFLDTAHAIYGPRIHRGWGTWRPDRFLTHALNKVAPGLPAAFNAAMSRGFQKAGL